MIVLLLSVTTRDAGVKLGQGGGREMQGHSRPMMREANKKLGGSGLLPRKKVSGHTLKIGLKCYQKYSY